MPLVSKRPEQNVSASSPPSSSSTVNPNKESGREPQEGDGCGGPAGSGAPTATSYTSSQAGSRRKKGRGREKAPSPPSISGRLLDAESSRRKVVAAAYCLSSTRTRTFPTDMTATRLASRRSFNDQRRVVGRTQPSKSHMWPQGRDP